MFTSKSGKIVRLANIGFDSKLRRFENYYHGDEDSFDGPGGKHSLKMLDFPYPFIPGVVAHAFFPEFGGDAHFDSGEKWTVNKYSVS